MLFEEKVKTNRAAFVAKVNKIAALLGIQADWLMAVMYFESRLNEKAVNRSTNATGLIQFMPATAAGLGTSVQSLLSMTNLQQLDYVYAYYKPRAGKLKSLVDLYLCTFFPAAIGMPDQHILQTSRISAGSIAKVNQIFDQNKDLKITVGEIKTFLRAFYEKEIGIQKAKQLFTKKRVGLLILGIGIAGIFTYYLVRQRKTKQKR
jgi:hypothetical protein